MFHFIQRPVPESIEKSNVDHTCVFKQPRMSENWGDITGPELFTSLQNELRDHINTESSGKFDTRHLDTLREWLRLDILPVVDQICDQNSEISRLLAGPRRAAFLTDLEQLLLRTFGEVMSKYSFQMCIDYPDSQPILLDLRYCLKATNIRDLIVDTLKTDLIKRLLHTGVTTVNIVDAYVSVVRSLKFLDPDGILLQLVTPPVREYLKKRDETIRVILMSLTEESGDLAEELSRNPELATNTNLDSKWECWQPDPIDVPKDQHNLRGADLIQTFVSIYGCKGLFIEEYRALLADRLLKMAKPITSAREVKCLELLKLRFGEYDLQKCEVMLKDIADSQRMNTRFNEDHAQFLDEQVDFSGLIVSAQFWPDLKMEQLLVPSPIKEAIGNYTKTFETIKGNRSLEWHTHIGTVDIEMEHLARWTLEELAEVTKIPVASLPIRMRYWVTRGVLTLSKGDVYTLHDDDPNLTRGLINPPSVTTRYMEDDEMENPLTSIVAIRETELQMFWSYIEGMLTNLGTLPLVRIHSMLKLFTTVECSSDDLQKFLDAKVSQGILIYSSGQYQLQK